MKRKYYSSNNSSGDSVSFLWVLQIIFITLKLSDIVDWPWRVVFMPTWISLSLFVIAVIIIVAIEAFDKYN